MRRNGSARSGLLVVLLAVGGCGAGDRPDDTDRAGQPAAAATSGPATSSTSSAPLSLQATFTAPKPDHVLQVEVRSATRTGDRITLVLAGTYGGTRTTQWSSTTIKAGIGTANCQVSADPGFPTGTHRPGSVVTGTWALTCRGDGPVRLVVDPFGGLLDSDTSFKIELR
ncbi:hypothetical protein OHA72_45545 [Dactylosporangium sp. NBC_01737]|uniref:hypothetical protein n=1 Tax=Dactylosporangium sp. NBC_01737 TaxID=2975959 RepID=UPI002E0D7906|nr:hypothetical protein OHA72_45545 [Dactylosporangium sp. NBC_01737]